MYSKMSYARLLVVLGILLAGRAVARAQSDVIPTSNGDLRITPIQHGSLMLEFDGKVIYVDPSNLGSYAKKPANLILITHSHGDHMNRSRVDELKGENTIIFGQERVTFAREIPEAQKIFPGQKQIVLGGIEIEGVHSYNLAKDPNSGELYHPQDRGLGFILGLGDKRIYISGDTDCTPEMKALQNIDVAFLSMNPPYTMSPSDAAACVKAFKPKVVYPYHYAESNLQEFSGALQGVSDVEVRLRKWY
jgi:L-ascorbate metabolism protein UlaG (beta-lactamase superfamily)